MAAPMPRKPRQRESNKRPKPTKPAASRKLLPTAAVCLALAVVTLFAFRNVRSNDFVQYDDDFNIQNNPQLHQGITPQSIHWAFTTFFSANWHPLTWLTHMADWSLYGENPGPQHLTSLYLHAANSILLFLALFYMTGFRARSAIVAFLGLGQTTLAYNRAGEMNGAFQLASYNRARVFHGGLQLGAYNRTDEDFTGLARIGLFDHARGDFSGLVQVGIVSATGPEIFGDGARHRFAGIAQIGAASVVDGSFYGVAQVGAVSLALDSFNGVVQVGALGAVAKHFRGFAQVGALTVATESGRGAQIGAVAVSSEDHEGVQLGVLGNYARGIDGAQVGLVNLAHHVKGVQVGLFNHAKTLRGLQIGLVNHADDGVLPWSAILNMGFGDGDGGGSDDVDENRRAAMRD